MNVRYSAQRSLVPEADGLDALDGRVGEEDRAEQVQVRGRGREEPVELVQQAVVGVPLAGDRAAGEVRGHLVEGRAQLVAVGAEDEDDHAEQRQREEVQRAVDRDQAQDDPVAQRLAAQRQLDLVALARVLARGRARAGRPAASESQRRQRCQRTPPASRASSASCGAERARVERPPARGRRRRTAAAPSESAGESGAAASRRSPAGSCSCSRATGEAALQVRLDRHNACMSTRSSARRLKLPRRDRPDEADGQVFAHSHLEDLVVITGFSGAGKSTAMNVFEDAGYFCVDNLPPEMIRSLVELFVHEGSKVERAAVVSDVRGGEYFEALRAVLDDLDALGRQPPRAVPGGRRGGAGHPLQGDAPAPSAGAGVQRRRRASTSSARCSRRCASAPTSSSTPPG